MWGLSCDIPPFSPYSHGGLFTQPSPHISEHCIFERSKLRPWNRRWGDFEYILQLHAQSWRQSLVKRSSSASRFSPVSFNFLKWKVTDDASVRQFPSKEVSCLNLPFNCVLSRVHFSLLGCVILASFRFPTTKWGSHNLFARNLFNRVGKSCA